MKNITIKIRIEETHTTKLHHMIEYIRTHGDPSMNMSKLIREMIDDTYPNYEINNNIVNTPQPAQQSHAKTV